MSKWYLHIQIPFGCRETIPAKPASRVCSKWQNKQDEYVSNAYPADNEKIWMVWMRSHCVFNWKRSTQQERRITVTLSSVLGVSGSSLARAGQGLRSERIIKNISELSADSDRWKQTPSDAQTSPQALPSLSRFHFLFCPADYSSG